MVVGSSVSFAIIIAIAADVLTTFDETMRLFERRDPARAIVVNVCNVHSVMTARKDPALADAFARAEINTSDGMPLVWVLRSRGHAQPRMYGPTPTEPGPRCPMMPSASAPTMKSTAQIVVARDITVAPLRAPNAAWLLPPPPNALAMPPPLPC
jgi:hypothetical protein